VPAKGKSACGLPDRATSLALLRLQGCTLSCLLPAEEVAGLRCRLWPSFPAKLRERCAAPCLRTAPWLHILATSWRAVLWPTCGRSCMRAPFGQALGPALSVVTPARLPLKRALTLRHLTGSSALSLLRWGGAELANFDFLIRSRYLQALQTHVSPHLGDVDGYLGSVR
jgi:hypothetical protein